MAEKRLQLPLNFSATPPGEGYVGTQHQNDAFVLKNALRGELFNSYESIFAEIYEFFGDIHSDKLGTKNNIGDAFESVFEQLNASTTTFLTYYFFAQMGGGIVLPDPDHQTTSDEEAHEFDSNNTSTIPTIQMEISGGTGVLGLGKTTSAVVVVDDETSHIFDSIDEDIVGNMTASDDTNDWTGGELQNASTGSCTLDHHHIKGNAVTPDLGAGPVARTIIGTTGTSPAKVNYTWNDGDFDFDPETGEITNFSANPAAVTFYYVYFQYRRDVVVLKQGTSNNDRVLIRKGTPEDELSETTTNIIATTDEPLYEVVIRPENDEFDHFGTSGATTVLPDNQIVDLRVGRRDEEARKGLTNGVVQFEHDRFMFDFRDDTMKAYVKAMDAIVDGALVRTEPTIITVPAADTDTRFDIIRTAKDGTVDVVSGSYGLPVVPEAGDGYAPLAAVEILSGQTTLSGSIKPTMALPAQNKSLGANVLWTKDRPLYGFDVQDQADFTLSLSGMPNLAKEATSHIASMEISGGRVLINGVFVDVPDMTSPYSLNMSTWDNGDYQLIWMGVNKSTLKIDTRGQKYESTERWEALSPLGWESYKMINGQGSWDDFVPLYVFIAAKDTTSKIALLSDERDFHPVLRPRIKTGIIWKTRIYGEDWSNERIILRHDIGVPDYAVFIQPIGVYPADPVDPVPAIEYISNNQCTIHISTDKRLPSTLSLWSKTEDVASITNPEVGPPGTILNSPTFPVGKFGRGVGMDYAGSVFNGVYHALPYPAFNTDLGCFEVWVKPVGFSIVDSKSVGGPNGAYSIFEWKVPGSGGHYVYVRFHTTNGLEWLNGAADQWISVIAAIDIPDGTWAHLAFTWDRSHATKKQRVFFNGIEVASRNVAWAAATDSSTREFRVGYGNEGGNVWWEGVLDNYKFWDYQKLDFSDRNTEGYIAATDTLQGFRWLAIAETDMIEYGTIKAGYDADTSQILPINFSDKMYDGDVTYPAILLSNIYHDDWENDKALTAYQESLGTSGELIGISARIHDNDISGYPTPHYINYAIFPDSMLMARGNSALTIADATYEQSGYVSEVDDLDINRITLAQHYELDDSVPSGVATSIQRATSGNGDQLRIVGVPGDYNINWFTLREPVAPIRPYGRQDL